VAKLVSKGKIVLGVWYLVLWGICSYALFEWFYPHTDYMAMPQIPLTVEASLMLFLATGLPLLLYLRKHEPKAKATSIFLVATILLSVFIGLNASVSVVTKARIQWYMDDLQNQGFNVNYQPSYPYGQWHADQVYSYSNLTSIARSINCTTIYVDGGTPRNYIFFMPNEIVIVAAVAQKGYYILYV